MLQFGTLVLTFGLVLGSDVETPSQQAKHVCESMIKAFLANDVDGVMKSVAVPFYDSSDAKGHRIVRDWKQLSIITKAAMNPEPAKHVAVRVVENYSYGEMLSRSDINFSKEEKNMFDQVMNKEDSVLVVVIQRDDRNSPLNLVMVGCRNGKAKVVGFYAR